ncbi:MAG: metalloendopeptidase-like membrane protein [Solidesulfovibrio magneticus str. Maddingley MBC34]|uniref:Metalloendopeptidase-like membrane protein n=1 Tax=Solidesulfovibrio magneticus str. Maddingley MBC34 TaxID=1206767 RepID=K6G9S6_9BACT|nr:MAG: metalloendopeptidase-like membrane protein [Solidesulfovibrio magneticus str. Maddingley MBC34]
MPKTLARLLPAAVCLLPNLLFAAAQPAPPSVATNDQDGDSYTVQVGDTLVSIARRLGLAPQALAKANALERPDKIVAGNVLRLPVTLPEATQPAAPIQARPSAPVQPHAQAQPPTPGQAMPQPRAPSPDQPPAKAAAPGIVPPPATAEPAQTQANDATEDAAQMAIGTYANPTLGSLRVTQTATGIAVSRDNRTIPMRHLLYGVFDGVDASGDIHGLRLQYNDDGQVRAVLYSSSSGKDIPFARVKK